MAKIYGQKSKYLLSGDNKWRIIGGFIIPVLVFVIWFCISKLSLNIALSKTNTYIAIIAIALSFLIFKKFYNLAFKNQKIALKIASNFRRGWKGEDKIFDTLKNLSDDYIIFRDVNLYEKGNIDFVILGPCGLLAVEVKSHNGIISYNNNELLRNGYKLEKDFISQTKREALDLKKYLLEKINKNIFVIPVLVFSSKYAKMRFGLNPINDCFVIQQRFLLELIQNSPNNMLKDEVDLIEKELSKLYF